MKTRIIVFALSTVLLVGVNGSAAQEGPRRTNILHPCPGGTGSAEVEVSSPTSLDNLLRMSQLILVGTVAKVLPAFNTNPEHLIDIETHSLIAVEEVLYGTLPSGIRRVALVQMGGKAGPCTKVVPADPLVQEGEQYIFFLRHDDERPEIPNTTGSPRYYAVGYWSGKAKVVNGKIQFLPSAHPRLHEYDNMDTSVFIAAVEDRIKTFCEWHDLSFPCLLPKK